MNTNVDAIDLFFRDFLHKQGLFKSPEESKSSYPVDIFETSKGMHFEIPCTGFSKEDVKITVKSDILNIKYDRKFSLEKDELDPERRYICKGVATRSFDLGYKFSSKFDLAKVNAYFEHGLLKIEVPFSKEAEPREVKIK